VTNLPERVAAIITFCRGSTAGAAASEYRSGLRFCLTTSPNAPTTEGEKRREEMSDS
jgi:hypothetical protein